MNEEIRAKILEKIEEYDKIIITRHIRPDGDAIGSSRGLQELIKNAYPNKTVLCSSKDYSDNMAFIDKPEKTLDRDFYRDALCIIVDTATDNRISNNYWNEAALTIKIDHHVDIKPYGDISWVEDFRSSTCEMVTLLSLGSDGKLPLTKEAARCLYSGMLTDTGRFRFGPTTGDTLRTASALLDMGIDTERIHAELYLDSFDYLHFKADMLGNVKLSPNGVAYIYVSADMQRQYGLNREDASSVVGFLDGIRGSLIWLAFIDNMPEDPNYTGPSIRVRLRSRFLPINLLAQKYRGGGHENASGATVYSEREMQQLIDEADAILAEYKRTHEDWL